MTRSVPDLATLDSLDESELIDGYRSGFQGEPEPGGNRSLAYWHGWRNGATDKNHRKLDAEQCKLVNLWAARLRAAGRLKEGT